MFNHGKLYTALSRGVTQKSTKVLVKNGNCIIDLVFTPKTLFTRMCYFVIMDDCRILSYYYFLFILVKKTQIFTYAIFSLCMSSVGQFYQL